MAFDDETVRLFDTSCPLLNKEMPREEFDRKLRENSSNDHLLKAVIESEQEPISLIKETEANISDAEPTIDIGTQLTIDNRKFIIDSIDKEFNKVSLRDITFQSSTGFPIFRSETIDFVRRYVDSVKKQTELPVEGENISTPLFDIELVKEHISESEIAYLQRGSQKCP